MAKDKAKMDTDPGDEQPEILETPKPNPMASVVAKLNAQVCPLCGAKKHGNECPHCGSVTKDGDVTPITNNQDTLSNLEGGGSLIEALSKCGKEVTVHGKWRTGFSAIPVFEGVVCPTTAGVVMAARKCGYGVESVGSEVVLTKEK